MRRNADTIEDAAFLDVPARLARTLLRMCEEHGQADGGILAVGPLPSQNELAGMVGATRESVNKWLAKFRQDGLIRVGRGQFTHS
ncbi:MAG: Crp/Fnr family transcriptional regulator [Chloroflexota bacterium]